MGRRASTEQLAAYQSVQGAIRRGELRRPARCGQCGKRRRVQAHHADYSRPLDVSWECTECHGKGRRAVILAHHIPSAVRAKCKREGVSVRAQILKLLTEWTASTNQEQ